MIQVNIYSYSNKTVKLQAQSFIHEHMHNIEHNRSKI